jgi:lysozyme
MMNGIDLSGWQPAVIDWARVKSDGKDWAYLKSSEGSTGRDATFGRHRVDAAAAGVTIGAYHFGHFPPSVDPRAQAQFFFEASGGLGSNPGELPPTIDLESYTPDPTQSHGARPGPEVRDAAAEFLDECRGLFGCLGVLYGSLDYLRDFIRVGDAPELKAYALWLAEYPSLPKGGPDVSTKWPSLSPWGRPKMWQWSDKGYFLPVQRSVDTSVFDGDAKALADFCTTSRV